MASLTIQQRKNLEAAVRAATTAPSAANPLVTAAEQPWEEVSNVVRVKSGFGASGCRVGTDATTATVDAYAEWDTANASGAAWSTNKWEANSDLRLNSSIQVTTASGTFSTYVPSNATNNLTTGNPAIIVFNSPGQFPAWLQVDFGSAKEVTSYRIYDGGDALGPSAWELRGSNDVTFSTFDSLHSSSTPPPNGGWTSAMTVTNVAAYRYYRLHVTSAKNSSFLYLYELELSARTAIPTPNLVTGTQSFSPSTLKLYTTTSMLTELNSGEATISFKKIIGGVTTDYGSQESLNTFKARPASEFANCTSLFLKVAPVGAYTVGGLTINTTSSSVITTKSGAVTIAVNDVTVYAVETDGDVIATDITADDITMTGDLSMDTTKTTIATTTTTDATATVLKSIALAADKTMSIDIDIIANKASTATKNKYRIVGTFYRNGSGNVTQLGDLVSIDTNEADTDWNATIVANTGDQTVDVQITGEAATTIAWSGKITYNIA